MNRENQRLEQLLRSIKADQPSKDFTHDIMLIIADDNLQEEHTPSTLKLNAQRAPMHMTEEVMKEIKIKKQTRQVIYTKTEIIGLLVLSVICIALSFLVTDTGKFITVFDFEKINHIVSRLNIQIMLPLTIGLSLFIMDHILRSRNFFPKTP